MFPTFCPNPRCTHHHDQHEDYWGYWTPTGFYTTLVVGIVRRFKCLACGKGFSERTLSIDYYTKRTLDYREIHRAISQSESPSSIARHLGCSSDSVQNRADRLARNCLSLHTLLLHSMKLDEALVADGFESFDRSQFFPNNINLLLGKQSQFLFGITHTILRRKGCMTPKQKLLRSRHEKGYKPPPKAVEESFARLLKLIPAIWDPARSGKLTLWTDEHQAYPRAIERVPELKNAQLVGTFEHQTVSSKAARTIHNPLFSANYYDRELRKDIAAFRRESTCFTRNVANGLSRFVLHLVYHNYQKPHRVNPGLASRKSHAEVAGIDANRIAMGFSWLYVDRPFISKQKISYDNTRIWLKEYSTPLKEGRDYLPKYAMK
ncbi:MAG: hypothetical protein CVV47_10080 [Spirochaetae bacterium HGW-Spirochaetae-3]|jgi:hypothetical protein|nr:MAG: hypothetical protein CVV47_10080 [Spirochaetae bacterium HGW-Spirochaetae-3]